VRRALKTVQWTVFSAERAEPRVGPVLETLPRERFSAERAKFRGKARGDAPTGRFLDRAV